MPDVPAPLQRIREQVYAGERPTATVRDLLHWISGRNDFLATRTRVESALEQLRLRTDPDFKNVSIDERITFLPAELADSGGSQPAPTESAGSSPHVSTRGQHLPELPDSTHYDDSIPETADDDADEAGSSLDDDDERLLATLTDSRRASGPSPILPETTIGGSLGPSQSGDLLSVLEQNLNRLAGLAVERTLNELKIRFDGGAEVFHAYVTYLGLRRVMQVRVLLPFVQDAALELLDLAGHDGFTGTIGIDRDRDTRSYVVHATITTDGHSAEGLCNAVQQLIADAVRANKVIGRRK